MNWSRLLRRMLNRKMQHVSLGEVLETLPWANSSCGSIRPRSASASPPPRLTPKSCLQGTPKRVQWQMFSRGFFIHILWIKFVRNVQLLEAFLKFDIYDTLIEKTYYNIILHKLREECWHLLYLCISMHSHKAKRRQPGLQRINVIAIVAPPLVSPLLPFQTFFNIISPALCTLHNNSLVCRALCPNSGHFMYAYILSIFAFLNRFQSFLSSVLSFPAPFP